MQSSKDRGYLILKHFIIRIYYFAGVKNFGFQVPKTLAAWVLRMKENFLLSARQ